MSVYAINCVRCMSKVLLQENTGIYWLLLPATPSIVLVPDCMKYGAISVMSNNIISISLMLEYIVFHSKALRCMAHQIWSNWSMDMTARDEEHIWPDMCPLSLAVNAYVNAIEYNGCNPLGQNHPILRFTKLHIEVHDNIPLPPLVSENKTRLHVFACEVCI